MTTSKVEISNYVFHLRIVATLSTYRISKYMLQYAMTCLEPTAIIGRTTKTSVMMVGLKKIVKNHAACVPMVSKMSCFMMLILLIFNAMFNVNLMLV